MQAEARKASTIEREEYYLRRLSYLNFSNLEKRLSYLNGVSISLVGSNWLIAANS
jgi:hypothetical protein